MNKLSNDENIKNLKKRSKLRIYIMIFGLVTIVLSFLNLFNVLNIVYALIMFVITTILVRIREKTVINKSDELMEIESLKKSLKNKK